MTIFAPETSPVGIDLGISQPTSIEICAGAGGQALGLERAGFKHLALVEIDHWAAETLRANRPGTDGTYGWPVHEMDLHDFDGTPWKGQVDLLAGGVPCPPFSIAGKQLGADDERDLFPQALRLVDEMGPKAILLENVKGLSQKRFGPYRQQIIDTLEELGYRSSWRLLQAADYGVPQLRPRFILVALQNEFANYFDWPFPEDDRTSVGEALERLMGENGWPGAREWAKQATDVAPTLVGGSKKHGGADVGPTRAKAAWAKMGIKGTSIAEEAPGPDFPVNDPNNMPRLTVPMGGVIQGFPKEWKWQGGKTAQWRQVGNAFPPPMAESIGVQIRKALEHQETEPPAL